MRLFIKFFICYSVFFYIGKNFSCVWKCFWIFFEEFLVWKDKVLLYGIYRLNINFEIVKEKKNIMKKIFIYVGKDNLFIVF